MGKLNYVNFNKTIRQFLIEKILIIDICVCNFCISLWETKELVCIVKNLQDF